MKKYPDFWSVILGSGSHGLFLGYIVISLIAAFGMILVMASQKYKNSEQTPDKWSWRYFIANNSGNFGASLFVLPIFERVIIEFVNDPKWMIGISVGLGFGFYKLAKIANNYGMWTTDKISEEIANRVKQIQSNKTDKP